MRLKDFFTLVLCAGAVASCSSTKEAAYTVEHRGALRDIMHKGQIDRRISLQELEAKEHLYALGTAAGLKGEILIINSRPYTARVDANLLLVDSTFTPEASLLVWAQVPQWQSIVIPDSVQSYAALEHFIQQAARQAGVPDEKPFPFLLEGTPASASWHVIDWKKGDTEHSYEKHKAAGLHGISEKQAMQILGFYSSQHQGVFTHQATNMHMHTRSLDGKVFGHLDELELAMGMVLKLPR